MRQGQVGRHSRWALMMSHSHVQVAKRVAERQSPNRRPSLQIGLANGRGLLGGPGDVESRLRMGIPGFTWLLGISRAYKYID